MPASGLAPDCPYPALNKTRDANPLRTRVTVLVGLITLYSPPSRGRKSSSLKMLVLDAIAPVLGILSTLVVRIPENYLILFLPFFAGGFLDLGASDLLPQAHEKGDPLVSITFTLL